MTIVIGRKQLLIVASVALGLAILSGTYFSGYTAGRNTNTPVALVTTVCGPFEAPEAVLGIPTRVDGAYVTFEDGYTLRRTKQHSFYTGELGFFMLNGSEQAYALVSGASFDPCPSTE